MRHIYSTVCATVAGCALLTAGCSPQGGGAGRGGSPGTGGVGSGGGGAGTHGGKSGENGGTGGAGLSGRGGEVWTGGKTAAGGSSAASGGTGGNLGTAGGSSGGAGEASGGAASGGVRTGGRTGGTASFGGGAGTSSSTAKGGTIGTGGAGTSGSAGTPATGGATSTGGATAGGGASSSGGTRTGGTTAGGGTSSLGGAGGAGGATVASGDDFVSDVKVAVHPDTKTILVVTWTELKAADSTFLEFSFSGSSQMKSRGQVGTTGSRRDVVLGVPEKTEVTLHIVNQQGGVDYKTKDYKGTTGALPSGLPRPTFVSYNATLASPEQWMLGGVEDSTGGCADLMSCYYDGLFWIFIIDRQARVVWYWADPSSNLSSSYPRVARDGEYIVIDRAKAGMTHSGTTGVLKMTLDRQYYQTVAIDGVDDAIDVTTDGSVLYDTLGDLHERKKDGTDRTIWSCSKVFSGGSGLTCYSNTVNWVPADDTVLLSFPYIDTVAQIDRKSGTLVGQYGNASGSYAFSPSPWKLQFQHSPIITPQGTLLVSTHLPDYPDGSKAGPKQHAFEEFEIDRANKKLTQKWRYSDGTEWAGFKGFNARLANGNTLVNYGSGGVVREVTPDKKAAFEVKFDVATGDDYFNKMVGNTVLVADLYALNGGGPK